MENVERLALQTTFKLWFDFYLIPKVLFFTHYITCQYTTVFKMRRARSSRKHPVIEPTLPWVHELLSNSPPHIIASLKSRLISSQKIGTDYDVGLFQEESGQTIPRDRDTITVLFDIYSGVNRDEPIAIVYGLRNLMAIRQSSE